VLTALHRSTRAGTETVRYLGPEPIEVAPDETTLTFEFAALSFTNPHHNQYAVMMEGFDMDWMALGTSRRSTYTNLPPGRYSFRVKASNEDGLWNEAGTAIPIIVYPRFYQTWWFRLLVVGAALGAVALAGWSVSRRQYRRELARLKARQALDTERARISRDMHDEVGASLTEIAILSEIAQRELYSHGDGAPPDDAPSVERLSRIADTSRAMLDAIAEIIWAINPQHDRLDRLDRLSAYLREHAARVLEDAGMEARLSFPARAPTLPVTAEFRRNVFLVLKEALHNVIRHAGAHAVAVHLTLDAEGLALVIEDDGCGLPDDNKSPADRPSGRGGNGLGNMAHRAEEIGGTLDVGAAPGGGTRLALRAPLSPLHAIDAPPAAWDV
jgi:signal transduction histidine kinase